MASLLRKLVSPKKPSSSNADSRDQKQGNGGFLSGSLAPLFYEHPTIRSNDDFEYHASNGHGHGHGRRQRSHRDFSLLDGGREEFNDYYEQPNNSSHGARLNEMNGSPSSWTSGPLPMLALDGRHRSHGHGSRHSSRMPSKQCEPNDYFPNASNLNLTLTPQSQHRSTKGFTPSTSSKERQPIIVNNGLGSTEYMSIIGANGGGRPASTNAYTEIPHYFDPQAEGDMPLEDWTSLPPPAAHRHRSVSPKKAPSAPLPSGVTRTRSKSPTKRRRQITTNTHDYLNSQCKIEGCSAAIIVDDTRFLVCKHQLSHASNFFRTLFIDHRAFPITGVEQVSLNEYTVVVSGLRYPPSTVQFQWFLESSVPSPVLKDITEETLETCMRLSKRFQAKGLEVRCQKFICDNVNTREPVMAMCWLNWVLKHRFDKRCLEACLPCVARLSLVELEAHRPMITEKVIADILAMKLRTTYQQTSIAFQTIHQMDHFQVEVEKCPRCHRQRDQGRVRVYANPCQKLLGCERCMPNFASCELGRHLRGTDLLAFYQCDHGLWPFNEKTEDCYCQTELYKAQLNLSRARLATKNGASRPSSPGSDEEFNDNGIEKRGRSKSKTSLELPDFCAIENNNELEVACFGANFTDIIETIYQHNGNVKVLVFKNCNPRFHRLQLLPALDVKVLKIISCGITEIDDNAFENLESLEELDLSKNSITKLPNMETLLGRLTTLILDYNKISDVPKSAFQLKKTLGKYRDCGDFIPPSLEGEGLFRHLKTIYAINNFSGFNRFNETDYCLKHLSLQHNMFTQLTDSMFAGLRVHRMYLNHNKISYVSPNAFNDFIPLSLHLGNNNITRLLPGTFDQLKNLQVLDLSHNQWNTPESKVLSLETLLHLNLSFNGITHLPSDFFYGCYYIRNLDLGNNNLTELNEGVFDSLFVLTALNLTHNQLKYIPSKTFEKTLLINRLYLDNNHLAAVPEDLFMNLSDLKEVYLQNNFLSELPKELFYRVDYLNVVDLRNNGLTTLSNDSFNVNRLGKYAFAVYLNMRPEVSIYLHGNPLICDDNLAWFAKFIKTNRLTANLNKKFNSTCAEPPIYAGMDLQDVTFNEATENGTSRPSSPGSDEEYNNNGIEKKGSIKKQE